MSEEPKSKDSLKRKSPKFTITLPSDVAGKVLAEANRGKISQVIADRLRKSYAVENTEQA